MQITKRREQAGVTLTELLAVLAIVGLLATLAIPVVINRAAQAKFSVAKAEVEALAKGEDMAGLIHGYYVPLQLLDNIPFDNTSSRDAIRTDDLRNESANPFLIDIGLSVSFQYSGGNQPQLLDTSPLRLVRLETEWSGPFTQWQRAFKSANTYPSPTYERRDFPLDPWGNPYRLYSPLGITGSIAGTTSAFPLSFGVIDNDSFSNGQLTNSDDRFDRFVVISFGPDGLSDGLTPDPNDNDPEDDIIYYFGAPIPETTFVIP